MGVACHRATQRISTNHVEQRPNAASHGSRSKVRAGRTRRFDDGRGNGGIGATSPLARVWAKGRNLLLERRVSTVSTVRGLPIFRFRMQMPSSSPATGSRSSAPKLGGASARIFGLRPQSAAQPSRREQLFRPQACHLRHRRRAVQSGGFPPFGYSAAGLNLLLVSTWTFPLFAVGSLRKTMLDALMIVLIVAGLAAAAAYAGLCDQLRRRPDTPDKDRK